MTRKYSCIIIDDERPALKLIEAYTKKLDFLDVVASYESPLDALTELQKRKIDILLLDIQMDDMTGIELISILPYRPQIILTTAYRDYAIKGFELKVTDYLIKPFSLNRFIAAIQTAVEQIELQEKAKSPVSSKTDTTKDHFYVRTNHKMEKVLFKDIIYIESMREYVSIFTTARRFIVNMSMIKILEELPSSQFIRIHRSFILNLDKIISIQGNMVDIGLKKLNIGPSYRNSFFDRINTL